MTGLCLTLGAGKSTLTRCTEAFNPLPCITHQQFVRHARSKHRGVLLRYCCAQQACCCSWARRSCDEIPSSGHTQR